MVMRDLTIDEAVPTEKAILAAYNSYKLPGNVQADKDIREATSVLIKPVLNVERDSSWKEAYSCSFTNTDDLKGWIYQTGDKFKDSFDVRITKEGLLIKTPTNVDVDTRMYLWSPKTFEGDQWIEFDFRLESPKGLALVAICTAGSHREDFIQDHGVEKTGGMGTILGRTVNYHWEFMRRVEMMRSDLETQYLAKNSWGRKMFYGVIPRFEQNRWYRLRFVKLDNRLHGSINGKTVFDIVDDPSVNNGPVLNFGRIGLRQMYNTTMRYKNFIVYERNEI